MGYYIVKYNIDYKHLDNIKIGDMSIMYGAAIAVRLFFGEIIPVIGHINILAGALFLIRISGYLIKSKKVYQMLLGLEKQQFFIYAAHGVFLAVLVKGSAKIMPMNGGWLLIHYFGICILCIIILTGTGIMFKKLLPKVFSVLTGGR